MKENILKEIKEKVTQEKEIDCLDRASPYRTRRLFYEHTYLKSISSEHDKLFNEIFYVPKELKHELEHSLKEIKSKDDAIRIKSARYFQRQSYDTTAMCVEIWLAHPLTVELIIKALEKEENKKIIPYLIMALGMIAFRYQFKDLRIYEAVKPFFYDKKRTSKEIKIRLMSTLCNFENPEKWEYVYEVLKNKPNDLAFKLINRIIGGYFYRSNNTVQNMSREMKNNFIKVLMSYDNLYAKEILDTLKNNDKRN
ncbi:MAG: Unknown protein [uncultured Sulfurovum sp.]|uniref:Uncharacterized protein n=1 Tax=uncultured Sulfurovum sp. TaxID=269237 RepID=A0A6S6T612_9BACT|nr:MAG: Unknown protein [uncultured Sulfurovum sp.]